jgi:hypothetical protein
MAKEQARKVRRRGVGEIVTRHGRHGVVREYYRRDEVLEPRESTEEPTEEDSHEPKTSR